MISQLTFSLPNSLVFILDCSLQEIPQPQGVGIAYTRSCVAISTLVFCDGETSFTITDEANDPPANQVLRFDRELYTPSGVLTVDDVNSEVLVTVDVPKSKTRVRIWSNLELQPDKIFVRVGG